MRSGLADKMTEQFDFKTMSMSIDEKTMGQIMNYYNVGSHDLFAKYVKSLGIDHNYYPRSRGRVQLTVACRKRDKRRKSGRPWQ
jgi:hypothetical protein